MKIYQLTDIGDTEASTPTSNPTPARRVLYFLRRRSNRAASDDMIAASVFGGDKSELPDIMRTLQRVGAVRAVGR